MKTLGLRLTPPRGAPLREEAAYWLLRLEEGRLGPDDRARLDRWLDADPAHRAAFEAAQAACAAAGRHAAHPEMMALRMAALASGPQSRAPLWRVAAAVAAGVLIVSGSATFTAVQAPAESRIGAVAARLAPALPRDAALYRTAVGERSTVVLPDGSVATLNTDSVLKVAYGGGERGVRLLRGQAMFEVAKDPASPFRVYAGDRRITAVGTVFDVRLDGKRVKVSLVEGVVRVSPTAPEKAAEAPAPVTMAAGQVLEARPSEPAVVRAADIARATSWKDGVVVFDDAPLAEAMAEMNRYTSRPLRLSDPDLGGLRVSGVFKAGDPERFAVAMTEVFPLALERTWDGAPVLRAQEE